ncbi:MAG: glucans biosynthesis glucosyltransferase MdoH [Cardiobacteriaceae bacterium]|nr:glucans biosynthesis glucosyltransferase MdoH [Cardiobacteriaceae bacterium]
MARKNRNKEIQEQQILGQETKKKSPKLSALPPVPEDMPLAMPVQNLREKPTYAKLPKYFRVYLARFIAFGGALAVGTIGTWQLNAAMGSGKNTLLQWVLLFLFSLTFYWVSFSATAALAGIVPKIRRRKLSAEEAAKKTEKIAIVMPVYGEDAAMTGANLLSIAESVAQTPIASRCEIFILSDTQNADIWLQETNAFQILRKKSPLPVYYRRRSENFARKAGNVADFVRRFGGRYEYMLVLDADSLMTGETIAEMIYRMDAEARLGLLQSCPQLIGGRSLLARTIQFASSLYGGVVARGIDAWQGTEGNYWGHNALIRTRAFAESCGLPELKGRRPIGGHILSHDFVEAALLRRRGWIVRMDSDLDGSYEGLPPSLEDLSGRERRWAQGNLQHLGVLRTRGFTWTNRMHFAIGIAGYLMSPIWLLMLSVGIIITAQALFTQPEYFPLAHQLFPNWPTFDARKMLGLFFSALSLLLIPKFIGLLAAMILPSRRRKFGGIFALIKGFFAELFISTLYAPMMMLLQTNHIIDIILGRDSGWATQSRSADVMPWKIALARTKSYIIAGIIPLAVLAKFAPEQLLWLSPIILGLLLSPLLTRHSGNNRLGKFLARKKFLLIPSEISPNKIILNAYKNLAEFAEIADVELLKASANQEIIKRHAASIDKKEKLPNNQEIKMNTITARAKLENCQSCQELGEFLNKQEKIIIAANLDLLEKIAEKCPAATQ